MYCAKTGAWHRANSKSEGLIDCSTCCKRTDRSYRRRDESAAHRPRFLISASGRALDARSWLAPPCLNLYLLRSLIPNLSHTASKERFMCA